MDDEGGGGDDDNGGDDGDGDGDDCDDDDGDDDLQAADILWWLEAACTEALASRTKAFASFAPLKAQPGDLVEL